MSASNSPSKSPSRRVLGDLTPKAINTPTNQAYAFDPSRPHSPLKQVQTLSPQLFKGAENMPPAGAYITGRKRSIYEVDGVEDVEYAGRMYGGGTEALLGRGAPVTAAALREHTVQDIGPTAGSPTEPNTPSMHDELDELEQDGNDEPLELPDNSQDTQASKKSFSEYFDFESGAQPPPVAEAEQEPVAEPAKKKSKIELLRLSLGIGMYKVKTNQVSKRGKDIISKWEITTSNRSMDTSSSVALTSSVHSTTSQTIPSIKVSRPNFISANLDPGRPIGRLGTGPILLPTAISSRMIYDSRLPSSPPMSVAPEQLMSPVRAMSNFRTPVPQKIRDVDEDYEGEEMDLEGTAAEHLHRIREHMFEEGDLTSSAVKGHAAKGLMELMTSRR